MSKVLSGLLFLTVCLSLGCVKWTPFNNLIGSGDNSVPIEHPPAGTITIDDAIGPQMWPAADGGYLFAVLKIPGEELEIRKTDSTGGILWRKVMGHYIYPDAICQLPNNEYGFSANRWSTGLFFRLGASGNLVWSDSITSQYQISTTVSTSGFVVTGLTDTVLNGHWSSWIMKLNLRGEIILPQTTYDSINICREVIILPTDGSFMIVAYAFKDYGYADSGSYNLYKIDTTGNVLWIKVLWPESAHHRSYVRSLKQTADGGFVLSIDDGAVLKTDSQGNTLWEKSMPIVNRALFPTSDNGIIVVGEHFDPIKNIDISLYKINAYGDSLWLKLYGGENYEGWPSLVQTVGGGFVIAAATASYSNNNQCGFWLFKVDSTGNQISLY